MSEGVALESDGNNDTNASSTPTNAPQYILELPIIIVGTLFKPSISEYDASRNDIIASETIFSRSKPEPTSQNTPHHT